MQTYNIISNFKIMQIVFLCSQLVNSEKMLADWTELESATSAVTVRHSNQLNYQSKIAELSLFCERLQHHGSLL